ARGRPRAARSGCGLSRAGAARSRPSEFSPHARAQTLLRRAHRRRTYDGAVADRDTAEHGEGRHRMARNAGSMDRAVRMILGVALLALGLSQTVVGSAGALIVLLGGIGLATGTLGYCPLYRVFGWSTCRS